MSTRNVFTRNVFSRHITPFGLRQEQFFKNYPGLKQINNVGLDYELHIFKPH